MDNIFIGNLMLYLPFLFLFILSIKLIGFFKSIFLYLGVSFLVVYFAVALSLIRGVSVLEILLK